MGRVPGDGLLKTSEKKRGEGETWFLLKHKLKFGNIWWYLLNVLNLYESIVLYIHLA